jgi:hypothetical protein
MTAPKTTNVTAPSRPPGFLEEERHLASDVATERSEDGAADERGDEPAATHPDSQSVGEGGPCDRNELQPDRIDEVSHDAQPDHDRAATPASTPPTIP